MDIDFIARLLDLVERSTVAELDLTLDGARLRVVKSHGAATAPSAAPQLSAALPPQRGTDHETPLSPSAATVPPQAAGQRRHLVKAGFPGTFYRAPAPGAAPFVSVGDAIEDGRQLAIVEAMKTMNPVEADAAGTIVRIAVEDAQPVEAGHILFEIELRG